MREFGELFLIPIICIAYIVVKKKSYETVHIHIQSLIKFIQENNCVIATKRGTGKSPLFCGDGERVITIYSQQMTTVDDGIWEVWSTLCSWWVISVIT